MAIPTTPISPSPGPTIFIPEGFILLARKILDSEIWQNKSAWWLKVWLYILLTANHKDRGKFKRGQAFINNKSIHHDCNLTDEGVQARTIENVIKWLKSTEQITAQKSARGLIVTVCNYEDYQNIENYKYASKTEQKTEPKRNRNGTKHNNETMEEENNILSGKNQPDLEAPILYLNKKTGKHFDPKNESNQNLVRGRYDEGRSLEDFERVIDSKAAEWQGDSKMSKYLRPKTLFNKTNFENYFGEVTNKQEQELDPDIYDLSGQGV